MTQICHEVYHQPKCITSNLLSAFPTKSLQNTISAQALHFWEKKTQRMPINASLSEGGLIVFFVRCKNNKMKRLLSWAKRCSATFLFIQTFCESIQLISIILRNRVFWKQTRCAMQALRDKQRSVFGLYSILVCKPRIRLHPSLICGFGVTTTSSKIWSVTPPFFTNSEPSIPPPPPGEPSP